MKTVVRYFALVFPKQKMGYALDFYPEERAAYARENRKHIIGEYSTLSQAHAAIEKALMALID